MKERSLFHPIMVRFCTGKIILVRVRYLKISYLLSESNASMKTARP